MIQKAESDNTTCKMTPKRLQGDFENNSKTANDIIEIFVANEKCYLVPLYLDQKSPFEQDFTLLKLLTRSKPNFF